MNLFGYLLAIFSVSALLYPCYSLYLRHRSKAQGAPFLPYLSSIPSEFLDANWIKGYEFEKFVVSKFDRNYFSLFFWNGDKSCDNVLPVTAMNPDLEYDYRDHETVICFAAECRWMPGFTDGAVYWATHDEIEQFKRYERESGRNVFVIIAVGGTPTNPDSMYIVPLGKIARHMDHLTADFLMQFRRADSQSAFFFNKQAMRLQ